MLWFCYYGQSFPFPRHNNSSCGQSSEEIIPSPSCPLGMRTSSCCKSCHNPVSFYLCGCWSLSISKNRPSVQWTLWNLDQQFLHKSPGNLHLARSEFPQSLLIALYKTICETSRTGNNRVCITLVCSQLLTNWQRNTCASFLLVGRYIVFG